MNIQFGRLRPMYLHPAGQNLQRNRDRLWSFWAVSFENAAEKEKKNTYSLEESAESTSSLSPEESRSSVELFGG